MRKLAILGGTFDPVHLGHLLIAQIALNQEALEQVIWVPSLSPPHKQAAFFDHRLEMVQRAIADNPAFAISPATLPERGSLPTQLPSRTQVASSVEARSEPSYAIQTLIDLQGVYPNTHWYWIVGLDAFQTLPRWYRRQELASECDWLVAPRLVSPTPLGEEPARMTAQIQLICKQVAQKLESENISIRWKMLHMPWVEVSSSLIRQYCRDGCSIRYLVPEAVRIYIATHNLYA